MMELGLEKMKKEDLDFEKKMVCFWLKCLPHQMGVACIPVNNDKHKEKLLG